MSWLSVSNWRRQNEKGWHVSAARTDKGIKLYVKGVFSMSGAKLRYTVKDRTIVFESHNASGIGFGAETSFKEEFDIPT